MTIDLSMVKDILDDCELLVTDLDGVELDERPGDTSKGAVREHKVRTSRDLQRLAHQLHMAGSLVLNEYWVARGGPDMIHEREHGE